MGQGHFSNIIGIIFLIDFFALTVERKEVEADPSAKGNNAIHLFAYRRPERPPFY